MENPDDVKLAQRLRYTYERVKNKVESSILEGEVELATDRPMMMLLGYRHAVEDAEELVGIYWDIESKEHYTAPAKDKT